MAPGRVAVVVIALIGACSTYGQEEEETKAPIRDARDAAGSGSSSGDGASAADAAPAPEVCPPCAASATCIAAGCTGAGTNNACNKPYDVTTSQTVIVFACPTGPMTNLPPSACGGGGPKQGALLRLGNAASWTVQVKGQNPFLVRGDCERSAWTVCGNPSVTSTVSPLITIFVGTTKDVVTCAQLEVVLTAN